MTERTLHLMTQRGQPYGSRRKCCEMCGLMMVARPDSFWRAHTWTDDPEFWRVGVGTEVGRLVPCSPLSKASSDQGAALAQGGGAR